MNVHRSNTIGLALLCAAATACASGGTVPNTQPAPGGRRTTAELEALYQARADSALMNVHAADVAFMSGMIGHHAQALVMSGFAPENGASPSIRTLAARIINAQKDEIQVMQTWLHDRGQEVPEGRGMRHMGDHAGHAMMPGMLSQEQIDELAEARGPAFDRLFLTYMIQHHNGAVTMVHELFATDGAAQDDLVFKLASDIQVDQITEVARMQSMLDALPDPTSDH